MEKIRLRGHFYYNFFNDGHDCFTELTPSELIAQLREQGYITSEHDDKKQFVINIDPPKQVEEPPFPPRTACEPIKQKDCEHEWEPIKILSHKPKFGELTISLCMKCNLIRKDLPSKPPKEETKERVEEYITIKKTDWEELKGYIAEAKREIEAVNKLR